MEHRERAAVLMGTGFGRRLGRSWLWQLASAGRLRSLAAGDALWRHGQVPDQVAVIRRGLLREVRNGTEAVTLGVLGPRQLVGVSSALAGCAATEARALTDVEVLSLPVAALLRVPRERLLVSVHPELLAHNASLGATIDRLAAGSVAARVGHLLLELAGRFGDEALDGAFRVPVPLSRTVVALCVGARLETVSRLLAPLERKGVVSFAADGFEVGDLGALRALH